jgi:hypothetical protein
MCQVEVKRCSVTVHMNTVLICIWTKCKVAAIYNMLDQKQDDTSLQTIGYNLIFITSSETKFSVSKIQIAHRSWADWPGKHLKIALFQKFLNPALMLSYTLLNSSITCNRQLQSFRITTYIFQFKRGGLISRQLFTQRTAVFLSNNPFRSCDLCWFVANELDLAEGEKTSLPEESQRSRRSLRARRRPSRRWGRTWRGRARRVRSPCKDIHRWKKGQLTEGECFSGRFRLGFCGAAGPREPWRRTERVGEGGAVARRVSDEDHDPGGYPHGWLGWSNGAGERRRLGIESVFSEQSSWSRVREEEGEQSYTKSEWAFLISGHWYEILLGLGLFGWGH